MDKKLSLVKIWRSEARILDSAANIASGHGDYELANAIWALAQRLRKQANDQK